MFGRYEPPFDISVHGTRITCTATEDGFLYRRESDDSEKEHLILSKKASFFLAPIEPVNLPKQITHYLYIELGKTVVLPPKSRAKFYIKFPVEISVFVSKVKENWDSIDLITLAPQKYTLYGEITTGIICRYFKSPVYGLMPDTDPLKEGVMEVETNNKTDEWVKVNSLVFDAYHMKIYYDSKTVGMVSYVEIESEMVAETSFKDRPLRKGMSKSLELYHSKKIPVLTDKFIMEWGY